MTQNDPQLTAALELAKLAKANISEISKGLEDYISNLENQKNEDAQENTGADVYLPDLIVLTDQLKAFLASIVVLDPT